MSMFTLQVKVVQMLRSELFAILRNIILFIKEELVIQHINVNYMMNIILHGKDNGEKRLVITIRSGLTILIILKKVKFRKIDLQF